MTKVRRYGFFKDVKTLQIYRNPDPGKARWTRLCLPADFAANKLFCWNQKADGGATPWGTPLFLSGGWLKQYGVGSMIIVSGTSVYINPVGTTGGTVTANDARFAESNYFNWVLDKPNKKFTVELNIDNDREESDATLTDGGTGSGEHCVYDDIETFWTADAGVTLTEELTIKQKGTSSAKIVLAVTANGIYHQYGSTPYADWSAYDFICLWVYGANSGVTGRFEARFVDNSGANYARFDWTDNFTGWKRMVFPRLNPTSSAGTVNWAQVFIVFFRPSVSTSSGTWYLDRTVVDGGQWVKVEHYIPDLLDTAVRNVRLYSWDGAAYYADYFLAHDVEDNTPAFDWALSKLRFLDGTLMSQIRTDVLLVDGYGRGTRGQTKTPLQGSGTPGNLTYSSNYGCKQRAGFAIKMPPDDGQDSATGGISQTRIKMEVYYANGTIANAPGEATYEFEDSLNQYYGLRNVNKKYALLFHNVTAGIADFFQLVNLTVGDGLVSLLELVADHDDSVIQVKTGWAAYQTSKVFWGQELEDNPVTDGDTDGVPDFIEGYGSMTGIEPFVDGGGFT